ncbi:MAG: hypothetical protein WD097_05765 [Balneolales bacterium]
MKKETGQPAAVIDIGTNTALLLVAIVRDGMLKVLDEAQEIPRLGRSVDRDRRITPDAIDRLLGALKKLKKRIQDRFGDIDVVVTATSAMRDARNRKEVMEALREELGWNVTLLTGLQEAEATFIGALATLDPDLFSSEERVSVIDIGGGSTELACGYYHNISKGIQPELTRLESLDIGCVRFTERFFPYISKRNGVEPPLPPKSESIEGKSNTVDDINRESASRLLFDPVAVESMRKTVRNNMRQIGLHNDRTVGVAGTVTSLSWILRAHGKPYRSEMINGSVILLDEIRRLIERVCRMSVQELLDTWPVVMEGRADIFLTGLLILEGYLDVFGVDEITVSSGGLRHGMLCKKTISS